jgi:hypothetical protein
MRLVAPGCCAHPQEELGAGLLEVEQLLGVRLGDLRDVEPRVQPLPDAVQNWQKKSRNSEWLSKLRAPNGCPFSGTFASCLPLAQQVATRASGKPQGEGAFPLFKGLRIHGVIGSIRVVTAPAPVYEEMRLS